MGNAGEQLFRSFIKKLKKKYSKESPNKTYIQLLYINFGVQDVTMIRKTERKL